MCMCMFCLLVFTCKGLCVYVCVCVCASARVCIFDDQQDKFHFITPSNNYTQCTTHTQCFTRLSKLVSVSRGSIANAV